MTTATEFEPVAYTVQQVARKLQKSTATVYRLIAAGHLRTVPHMHGARIAVAELDRFVNGDGS